MIQPARTAHRRIFVVLALVLPGIMVIGLGARRPEVGVDEPTAQLPATAKLVRDASGLWQKHVIPSKFFRKTDRPQESYVVLQPVPGLNAPDMLLYWTDRLQAGSLPADARLLGSFASGKAFDLPLNPERTGYLVLFSLADQAVVDSARVEKLP